MQSQGPFGRKRSACRQVVGVRWNQAIRYLMSLWVLRLSLCLPSGRGLRYLFANPDFYWLTGLDEVGDTELDCLTETAFQHRVADRLRIVESSAPTCDNAPLSANLVYLAHSLGLVEIETEILRFACILSGVAKFGALLESVCPACTSDSLTEILAIPLDVDSATLKPFLEPTATLRRSGLVRVSGGIDALSIKLSLDESLVDALMSRHDSADELLARFFRKADVPKFDVDDFPHLTRELSLLPALLRNAIARKEIGLNVLIYGEPGTGKTEFCRLLGKLLATSLFEVKWEGEEVEPLSGSSRFSAYQLCQSLLARKSSALVLFDESEDVFSGAAIPQFKSPGLLMREPRNSKAWINRVLEHNPVPALWITNDVAGLDPAYLRRFALVLEFPRPVRSVRRSIAQTHFHDLRVSAEWLDRIAEQSELSPAQLGMAARVVRLLADDQSQGGEATADYVLAGSLLAIKGRKLKRHVEFALPYSVRLVNAVPDAQEIIAGLRSGHQATLCFFGPSGTGKSALARHIAEELGRPLLVKRASDLLSPWVGESEHNIARMFREAEGEGSVLLLDEADSFLADRRQAAERWEVTQTNELLSAMEDFDGIFICTTNLIEKIDPAVMRRFSFKVRFECTTLAQRQTLFMTLLKRFDPGASEASSLGSVHNQ